MKTSVLSLAVFLAASAALANDLPPLHEDRNVRFSFYSAGLADIVRNNCSELDGRMIRGLRYALALRNYALRRGYTTEEIDELLANKEEEKKLRAEIVADLAARGAVPGNEEAYCRVGREEIAKDSLAGRLLRDTG
ncbi:MAG: DUF5333 domain-containing protein [Paracoccaceae bacterium]|nr:DUF5333 domain-containing protein [Paracoccaceae bacterium]